MRKSLLITALLLLFLSFECSSNEFQKITISTPVNSALDLYVFLPEKKIATGAAAITVHGGGWKWGKASWTFSMARQLAAEGILAVAVEYRLSTNEITPIDAYKDVCSAIEWLRKEANGYNLDPNRVAAYGVSAGGHLSALAAAKGCNNNLGTYKNGGPDLLLLWSAALEVEKDGWFKKVLQGKSSVNEESPLSQIKDIMPPVALVQGEKDTLTPLARAEKYCVKVKTTDAECVIFQYQGVGHLLTRNLKQQESNFDPHPEFVKDGKTKLIQIAKKHGW